MAMDAAAVTRRLWAAVLMSNSLWVGFIAGAATGGRLFVPDDAAASDGSARVLWYGLGGALVTALASAAALRRLDERRIRTVAIVALVIAAALASYIAYRAGR